MKLGKVRYWGASLQEKKNLNKQLTLRFLLLNSINSSADASLKHTVPDHNNLEVYVAQWQRICLQCRRPRFDSWLGIGGRRERGRQRMRWLDGIIHSMDVEFEWTPGVGDGQRGLACCDSWGRKESDTTEWQNWTELHWGRSPREATGNPLECSCLENPMDREACWAPCIHGVAKSQMTLSN